MSPTELKQKLTSKNLQGLALDIDETLADSNTHWFDHMYKFHPPENISLKEIMKKHKFVEEVKGWETEEAFKHMESLLHSEEFNEAIPLIEDSNHVVNKINKIIPIVAYITARPITVKNSTENWLKKHGFPSAPIIMREKNIKATATDLSSRNKWKAEILKDLYPNVTGIIDDNAVLAHELENLKYEGTLYLYGPNTEEFNHYKHVITCPTWGSVLEKF
ncbi:MAG TPA: hypothetical protein VGC58_00745 [Candidatus Paceibacterota bacterium]